MIQAFTVAHCKPQETSRRTKMMKRTKSRRFGSYKPNWKYLTRLFRVQGFLQLLSLAASWRASQYRQPNSLKSLDTILRGPEDPEDHNPPIAGSLVTAICRMDGPALFVTAIGTSSK